MSLVESMARQRHKTLSYTKTIKSQSFSDFIRRQNPGLLDYEHVPLLVYVLQKVADTFVPGWQPEPGEPNWRRVLLLLPPRYFKTEVASRLFHAYLHRRFTWIQTGIVSYSANLAWDISSEAKEYYEQDGGLLRQDTKAKRKWKSPMGGSLWAEGVGGSMLGKGFHLCTLDDPQDPAQAHSPTYQERFKNFWPQKLYSRREPQNAIIVVMQRLAREDAAGWLLARELENAQRWHLVCCDAIRSDEPFGEWSGPMGLPPTCTLQADTREVGQILSPSRFNEAQVEETRQGSDDYTWEAQQQQRPGQVIGDVWQEFWFQVHDTLPEDARDGGRDWDTAYGKNRKNAASAYVESYRGPDHTGPTGEPLTDKEGNRLFTIYIEDCGWEWLEMPELVYWLGGADPQTVMSQQLSPLPGPHYVEQKASGKSLAQTLRGSGVPCEEVPVTGGDKWTRTLHVQPRVSRGLVSINRRILEKILRGDRQGLLRITAAQLQAGSGYLDLNDVFVQAINRHIAGRGMFIGSKRIR